MLWQPLQSNPEGKTLLTELECGFIALMLTQWFTRVNSKPHLPLTFAEMSGESEHGGRPPVTQNQKKYLESSLANRNVHRLGVKSWTLLHLNNPIWIGIGRNWQLLGHTDMLYVLTSIGSEIKTCGEEGGLLLSGDLASYGKTKESLSLPAFSKGLAPFSKARPHSPVSPTG